jgi:YVTN family beta-propeller protein
LTAGTAVATGINPNSVTIDPSGKFVYAANYSSNTISVYTIDQTTGALTVGTAVAAGINPYVVMIDPSGKFAYALNAVFSTISVYKIEATGALTAVPE